MTFPKINHINDILPFIESKDEFIVAEKAGYTVIDYKVQKEETFDSTTTCECRGIKFDKNGYIIARPYHKFFNHGEYREKFDWDQDHIVLEKLDGSLVHSVIMENEIYLMTRMGRTDVAKEAENLLTDSERELIRECDRFGLTPLFEFVSPNNRIVIQYNEPELILTGIRSKYLGTYTLYKDLVSLGELFNVKVVNSWGKTTEQLMDFLHYIRSLENYEGCVVRFDNGTMLKIKADQYVRMHKAKDSITLEKNVLKIVLNNEEDDLLPILPKEEAKQLKQYSQQVREDIERNAKFLETFVQNTNDRKEFATQYIPTLSKPLQSAAFSVFNGKNAYDSVVKLLWDNLSTSTRLERVKPLLSVEWNAT